ncbi:rhomboid family intramembrane serine protease [Leptospira sp. WS92.C1]
MIRILLFEFPLTTFFIFLMIVTFFGVNIFLPEHLIRQYFLNHPGQIHPISWIGAVFYHGSLIHLFGNMFYLFFLGRAVEFKAGKGRWLLFFFMAALISSLLDSFIRGIILHDSTPVVGASGAISGIAAVAALLSPFSLRFNGKNIPFPVFLVAWIMVYSDITNVFTDDGIARWAHLGGFISVIFAAYFLKPNERKQLHTGFILNVIFIVLTLILAFFYSNR